MNALTLLTADHKTVEALFKEFEGLGERASARKKQIVGKIIKELSIHSAIEEMVFYPAVRAAVEDAEDEILESLEEHHIVKWTLSELEKMSPDDERFDAKVKVLMESVRHHVKEEQTELFPRVREVMERSELADLGEALAQAKKVAPTHPHPRAPDSPPANLVAGSGAALVDRARDLVGKAAGIAKSKLRRGGKANGRAQRDSVSAH
jgi:hemerythrin superfamily protein